MESSAPSIAPSIEQIKGGMRAVWIAGDFGRIAKTMTAPSDAFVDGLPLPAEGTALDVACGTGNITLPLARKGLTVTGVDIAPNLLEQARARAVSEGLAIQFDEGDVEQLPYADASFDVVTTMFGAMFAPRPEVVAKELARVLKPGGLLAMGNWNPESFSGRMFQTNAMHVPPPPGLPPPVLWGDAETVKARLSESFEDIQTELIPVDFDLPTNPAGVVNFFRAYFGPTKVAFSRLDEAGQQALADDLVTLWTAANHAENTDDRTLVHNEYLRVVAKRKPTGS